MKVLLPQKSRAVSVFITRFNDEVEAEKKSMCDVVGYETRKSGKAMKQKAGLRRFSSVKNL
jgi:hypothetical protein